MRRCSEVAAKTETSIDAVRGSSWMPDTSSLGEAAAVAAQAKLKWRGLAEFSGGESEPWYARHGDKLAAGFVREHRNLALITVLGAGECGHSWPSPACSLTLPVTVSQRYNKSCRGTTNGTPLRVCVGA